HAGVLARLPWAPVRVGLEASWVGSRPATEFNALQNDAAYALPPYLQLDAVLSTVGLHPFGRRETGVLLRCTNLGNARGPDPGYGGVDYPLRPRTVFLQLTQEM